MPTAAELNETIQKMYGLAQDSFYLGDMNEGALKDLYSFIHNDFQKRVQPGSNRVQDSLIEVEAMKAELLMVREFNLRKISIPRFDDALTTHFNHIVGRIRKMEGKLYQAVTQPDIYDDHVHDMDDLNENGDGTTKEAGTPPHTHNVYGFMTSPVDLGEVKSDHPGKVDVKVGKSAFKVIKRLEDGDLEWQADFDLIKKSDEQRLVYGIVYEPDVEDAQGDSASPEEITKACHNFMIKSQTQGLMHEKRLEKRDTAIVENYIAPVSFMAGGQMVQKGSWVMVSKVLNDELWSAIKDGKYTGYSMGGKARDASRTMKREEPKPVFHGSSFSLYSKILKGQLDVEKVIRQVGDKFCVFTEDGSKNLGCHATREQAFRHLAAVEANKRVSPHHLHEPLQKAEDYVITADHMKNICTKCALLMKKRKITKVKLGTITDRNKFKRVFGIRRSSVGHNGLCKQYATDARLFKDAITKVKGGK